MERRQEKEKNRSNQNGELTTHTDGRLRQFNEGVNAFDTPPYPPNLSIPAPPSTDENILLTSVRPVEENFNILATAPICSPTKGLCDSHIDIKVLESDITRGIVKLERMADHPQPLCAQAESIKQQLVAVKLEIGANGEKIVSQSEYLEELLKLRQSIDVLLSKVDILQLNMLVCNSGSELCPELCLTDAQLEFLCRNSVIRSEI